VLIRPGGPVRICQGTRAELSPLSNSVFFFWSLKDDDGANPLSWCRCLGFGPTPTPGRDGWNSRVSETASPPSVGRPVHQRSGSSCLDRVGLSSPRSRSPRCYGVSVSLLSIPIGEPLGPGCDRQRVADLQPIGPTRSPFGRAGRIAGRGTGAGLQAGGLCLGSPGAGGRAEASAVIRSDPLELVASGLPAPREVTSGCFGLLAMAGWRRSADFELALDGWAEFGLSRFSASRGLDALERAGLVSVDRRPGRSPDVTIVDADTPKVLCHQKV
jgi:DNA-binding transcriptional ArsR family regulator